MKYYFFLSWSVSVLPQWADFHGSWGDCADAPIAPPSYGPAGTINARWAVIIIWAFRQVYFFGCFFIFSVTRRKPWMAFKMADMAAPWCIAISKNWSYWMPLDLKTVKLLNIFQESSEKNQNFEKNFRPSPFCSSFIVECVSDFGLVGQKRKKKVKKKEME